jgi:hypothetical protein
VTKKDVITPKIPDFMKKQKDTYGDDPSMTPMNEAKKDKKGGKLIPKKTNFQNIKNSINLVMLAGEVNRPV